jgi:hypothetical protein
MSKKTTSRKSKSVDVPIYVAGEEKLVMFGWCSTKQHKDCVIEFTGHKCSCDCHGSEGKND